MPWLPGSFLQVELSCQSKLILFQSSRLVLRFSLFVKMYVQCIVKYMNYHALQSNMFTIIWPIQFLFFSTSYHQEHLDTCNKDWNDHRKKLSHNICAFYKHCVRYSGTITEKQGPHKPWTDDESFFVIQSKKAYLLHQLYFSFDNQILVYLTTLSSHKTSL